MIQDNILLAHKVFHYLQTRRNTRKVYCALKLNMQKAYERVEWDFLLKVLERRGFHAKWIGWIQACITSFTYKIKVNDKKMRRITPSRGLRQEDSLSPYFFILIADVLSRQVEEASHNHRFEGLRMGPNFPKLHYMLFANDSLFFINGTLENVVRLKGILVDYCNALAQHINTNKSCILFSINATEEKKKKRIGERAADEPNKWPRQVFGIVVLMGKIKEWSPKLSEKII